MNQKSPLGKIIFFLALFISFVFATDKALAQVDSLADLPEYKLPLTDKKMVVAHCMTHIIHYEGHDMEDGANSKYYPITAPIGGYTQVKVMSDSMMAHATLDQAVEFEMRAAKKIGIDGFQFYYPIDMPVMDTIIEAYFRVAQEKNIDFKFTFCISPFGLYNIPEDARIFNYATRINGIMNTVGRDNPHWLRTPDGRLILYMWYGEQMADIPPAELSGGRPAPFFVARAYRKLANLCNDRFACVYSINGQMDKDDLDDLLDYFPAAWLWTGAYQYKGLDQTVVNMCKKRGRAYTASLFNDFCTSKVLVPGDVNWTILTNEQCEQIGLHGMERRRMVTGLSTTY